MSDFLVNPSFARKDFLQRYWQQKPTLLPGLVTGFSDPLSAEELAGLACEELVESRLISQFEEADYRLQNGPFSEADFTQLPDSNWTLLVQAVDQWVDEIADLKRLFEFIPNWRIDDVMVSFATPGGGVGPHFDQYDVFLVQGYGTRNWKVGQRCSSSSALLANNDLRLLQEFEAEAEYVLNSGDALYIPPRYAHWGVATSDSLCYSIGFRAPSMAEMIEGFSDFVIKEQDEATRFQDSDLQQASRSGEILASQLDASFAELSAQLSQKEKFTAWFGCHVSQPKYPELVTPAEPEIAADAFTAALDAGISFYKNPSSRFAFLETSSAVLLFVDGAMVSFPRERIGAIASLCDSGQLFIDLSDRSDREHCTADMAELLRQLVNQGSLLLSE